MAEITETKSGITAPSAPVELIKVKCDNCGFITSVDKNGLAKGEVYCSKCWSTALSEISNDTQTSNIVDNSKIILALKSIRDGYDKAIKLLEGGQK